MRHVLLLFFFVAGYVKVKNHTLDILLLVLIMLTEKRDADTVIVKDISTTSVILNQIICGVLLLLLVYHQ
jgi:hypothetical protein